MNLCLWPWAASAVAPRCAMAAPREPYHGGYWPRGSRQLGIPRRRRVVSRGRLAPRRLALPGTRSERRDPGGGRTPSRHVNGRCCRSRACWLFHVDAIRRPAAAYARSAFPDALTQLIDDERRDAYAAQASRQFETDYVLVVTHLPPPDAFSRLGAFFVQGADRARVDWAPGIRGSPPPAVKGASSAAACVERLDTRTGCSPARVPDGPRAPGLPPLSTGRTLNAVCFDQEARRGLQAAPDRASSRSASSRCRGCPHASQGQGGGLSGPPCRRATGRTG